MFCLSVSSHETEEKSGLSLRGLSISGVFGDLASNFLRKIDTCKQMMPNIEDVVGQGLIFQKNHFVSEHPPTTTTTPVCILDRVQETGKDPTQPFLDNSTAK